jgi:hypothetical protein
MVRGGKKLPWIGIIPVFSYFPYVCMVMRIEYGQTFNPFVEFTGSFAFEQIVFIQEHNFIPSLIISESETIT